MLGHLLGLRDITAFARNQALVRNEVVLHVDDDQRGVARIDLFPQPVDRLNVGDPLEVRFE